MQIHTYMYIYIYIYIYEYSIYYYLSIYVVMRSIWSKAWEMFWFTKWVPSNPIRMVDFTFPLQLKGTCLPQKKSFALDLVYYMVGIA